MGGKPDRTFLAGHSLGGGIGLSLVEQFPGQYDGALLMCGIVGGSLVETQYLGQVRALFDFFYPGALPGDVVSIPPGTVVHPAAGDRRGADEPTRLVRHRQHRADPAAVRAGGGRDRPSERPAVPAFHEAALLEAVQAAGATDLLWQRFVPSFGHCNIPAAFAVQSFVDLATWVSTGNQPAS